MLKLKNYILLFFGIAIATGFLLTYNNHLASSDSNIARDAQGRVLGVSEEKELAIHVDKKSTYPSLDVVEKITPVIDKSKFKPLKKEGSKSPSLSWGSILAMDVDSGDILYSREIDKERSLASITKLATALVLMDLKLDWEQVYEIKKTDRIEGGRIYIRQGEKIKLRDLLYVSLVASANTATRSLVSASGLSYEDFVKAMNAKAEELGLEKTHFVDPVGMSSLNVSTARELAHLVQTAIQNGVIRDCLLRDKYVFSPVDGSSKTIRSTDILLNKYKNASINILGGKTGFTGAAGYCFAGMFEGASNNKIITIVLGARSHNSRFADTEKLVNWVYSSYEWRR